MNDQRLYVSNIGQQGEDLQAVNEPECLFLTALDLKGENRSAAIGEILLIQGMVRMVRQAGVVDLGDLRVLYQIFNDRLRVSVPCSSRKAAKGEMQAP